MKLRYILILAYVALPQPKLNGQYWQTVGGGLSSEVRSIAISQDSSLLLACGAFDYAGGQFVNNMAAYNGDSWQALGSGLGDSIPFIGGVAISIAEYDSAIFTSGQFVKVGDQWVNEYLARWDGNNWLSCGNPDGFVSLQIANNLLFATGNISTIGGSQVNRISVWGGDSWVPFGSAPPFANQNGSVDRVAYFKGQYYFAGNFGASNGSNEIIRWDGSQWLPLQYGILGDAWIWDIVPYRGLLFVAGHFYQSAGNLADFLLAWDGSQWIDPFPDVQFTNQVRSLEVIDDKLYISGGQHHFSGGPSSRSLAHYDGQTFCSFGTGDEYTSLIAGFDNRIFAAGGGFITATDTIGYFAEWIGGNSTDNCIAQPISTLKPEPLPLISLYPNPTNGVFTIELNAEQSHGEIKVEIIDALGREVFVPVSLNGDRLSCDLSGLATGIYGVRVMIDGQVKVGKVVKQ